MNFPKIPLNQREYFFIMNFKKLIKIRKFSKKIPLYFLALINLIFLKLILKILKNQRVKNLLQIGKYNMGKGIRMDGSTPRILVSPFVTIIRVRIKFEEEFGLESVEKFN